MSKDQKSVGSLDPTYLWDALKLHMHVCIPLSDSSMASFFKEACWPIYVSFQF
jgi:hypothetical protein